LPAEKLNNSQASTTVAVMPRFVAIDGLRTWLAWTVVGTHIIQQALLSGGGPRWIRLDIGGEAVNVFIIISGFVIAHLLIEQKKSYAGYLIPRLMRLFPAFFVSCVFGGLAYWAAFQFGDPQWSIPVHGPGIETLQRFLVANIFAHLTMFHGLIPNSILPSSEYAFNNPGWSVSLEWQFYIIAPFAIRLAKSRIGAVFLVLLVVICAVGYHVFLKDHWDRPSLLIGAAKFFIVGIACRYAAPSLVGRVKFVAAFGLGLGFTFLWIGSLSLAIWMLVYSFILKDVSEVAGVDRLYVRMLQITLESRFALWLADRSYSTYLFHWPLLMFIGTAATNRGVQPGSALALLMLLVIPATLLVQEAVYRFVEVPGRSLGKSWASRFGDRPAVEIMVESVASYRAGVEFQQRN
jgi:peptidoglycan/LPS O-acetylase OafA/YrhL